MRRGSGTMLLADVREILGRLEGNRIAVAHLATELGKMEDRPWPEFSHGKQITTVKVSRMLKRFGLASATQRDGCETFKGYQREAFGDVFDRYLPTLTNA